MTFIQKIVNFFKKKNSLLTVIDAKVFKINKFNSLFFISFLTIFSALFFISSSIIDKKNQENFNNLKELGQTNEFSKFSNYLISKLNSPYEEINYTIKNNDTVEKILKNYKIRNEDINEISIKLKEKKLANIYSGRKLSLIIKKLDDSSNSLINFVYVKSRGEKISKFIFSKRKYFTTK